MLASIGYTSSILFAAVIFLYIGGSPLLAGHSAIFALESISHAALGVTLWFFVIMAASGPIDAHGILSLTAWSTLLWQGLVGALILFALFSRGGDLLRRRYEQSLQGFLIIGAGSDTVREALQRALAALNIEAIESAEVMRLPALGCELRWVPVSWIGAAHVVMLDKPELKQVLRQITSELEGVFATTHRSLDKTSCLKVVAVGVIVAFLGITKH